METANAIPQKQTLRNGKSQDWIEHPSFGFRQASESREGKLDIDFLNQFSEPWQENASQIDGTQIRRLTQPGFQVSSRPTSLPQSRSK
jgi:hypothetical protein